MNYIESNYDERNNRFKDQDVWPHKGDNVGIDECIFKEIKEHCKKNNKSLEDFFEIENDVGLSDDEFLKQNISNLSIKEKEILYKFYR